MRQPPAVEENESVELQDLLDHVDQVRALLEDLTGKVLDESVTLFLPFYSEVGKNLAIGRNVFINMGCRFQDTGGIAIGEGSLIGHGATSTAQPPRRP
jgi:acetyltransferase-like isoleucine patch superfamily enzyme